MNYLKTNFFFYTKLLREIESNSTNLTSKRAYSLPDFATDWIFQGNNICKDKEMQSNANS